LILQGSFTGTIYVDDFQPLNWEFEKN
jgi:hypothetical protein